MTDYTNTVTDMEDAGGGSALCECGGSVIIKDCRRRRKTLLPERIRGPEDGPYWSLLDPDGTGVMGYLEIPKISLRLPDFPRYR